MKTNQISNNLVREIQSELKQKFTSDEVKSILETYVELEQKKYEIVSSPAAFYERYKHIAYESNEIMIIAVINNRFNLIHDEIVYRGLDDQVAIDIKDILKVPLQNNGSNFVIIHNHPSGNPEVSEADINMARRTGEAAAIMGLTMLDSITVAKDGYDSIRSNYTSIWNNFEGVYKGTLREKPHLLVSDNIEKNRKINILVDKTFDNLKGTEAFKDVNYTAFENAGKVNLVVEDKEVLNISLSFEITEDMNPNYLAKEIVEKLQFKYELPVAIQNDLVTIADNMDDSFRRDIEAAIKPLQVLAEEKTGTNGLKFDSDSLFTEKYSDFKTGSIDVKGYVDDILKSFITTKMDHQSCVELLEVVYLFSEQTQMKVEDDLSSFQDLHNYVLEDMLYELTSGENDYLNLNLEYDVDSFDESYREVFQMYSNNIMRQIYEDHIWHLDFSKIYNYDGGINLYGEYKFINAENTLCFNNINWKDLSVHQNLDINDLRSQLLWFEEEFEEDYSKYHKIVNEFEAESGRGKMVNINSLETELNKIYKEFDTLFKVKNDEVKVFVNEQLEYIAGTIDPETGIITQNYSSRSFIGNENRGKEYTPNEFYEVFKNEGENRIHITKAEEHVKNALYIVFPESSGRDISGAARFNILCQCAYLSKDEEAIEFLNEIEEDNELTLGYKIMLNKNIDEVGEAAGTYLKKTNNKMGVDEAYKLNLYRVEKFFEYFPNIDDQTKIKLLKIPKIEAAATVKDFENTVHEFKLLETVNLDQDMKLFAEDVLALKDHMPIINDILNDGKPYKISNAAKNILSGNQLTQFEIKISEYFEMKIGKFDNEIKQIDMLNTIIADYLVNNDESTKLFLTDLIDSNNEELSKLLTNNVNSLTEPTRLFMYVQQSNLNINSNDYLLESLEVKKFFQKYPQLTDAKDLQLILLDDDKIKQNIMNKMPMSSGQNQLIDLANRKENTTVSGKEVSFLDNSNLKLSKKLIEIKKLKISDTVKGLYKNIDKVGEKTITHSR